MVLDINTVAAIVTIIVGVIAIYSFLRPKSQQKPKPPEAASRARVKQEEAVSNVRDSISADLEKNRLNLVGLFSSGGRDYLDHTFTLTTWNHYKSKIELLYPTIFSDFLEVYSNLEKLNEVIKTSLGTVDYSDPKFISHKKLAWKTEEKIRSLLENLND